MVSTSYVVVAAKKTARDTLQTAIGKMPQPIPISSDTKRIIIKPSICYTDLPGSTSLEMMKAVTEFFQEVAPLSIVESDNPMRTTEEAFEKLGYTSLIRDNVELFNLSADNQIISQFAGNGIHEEEVSLILEDHKFLVNVATVKKQGAIEFGAGIKNLFGLLSRRDKNQLHAKLDLVLEDLLIKFRPTLTILDLTEVVIGDRKNRQTKPLGGVMIGTDPVAVDAYCAHLLGLDPLKVEYIKRAFEAGLGEALPERIHVLGTEYQIQKIADSLYGSTNT